MTTQILLLIFFLCTRLPTNLCQQDYFLRFDRAEGIRGDYVTEADYSGMAVRRATHGRQHVLNGTYTFTRDFNYSDTCSVEIKRSASGNSLLTSTPFSVPETYAPDFFNNVYLIYAEPMFEGKTNFPPIPPDGLDYVPKGTYYVKEAMEEDMHENLPFHLEPGWYWVSTYFRNHKDELIGGLRIIFQAHGRQYN